MIFRPFWSEIGYRFWPFWSRDFCHMLVDRWGFLETRRTPPSNFSESTLPEDGDYLLTDNHHYSILKSLSLFWLAESVQWIFEIGAVTSSSCRLYNNHVKGTQSHGWSCHVWPQCHVKFTRVVLLAVSEEENMTFIFIIKQLLDSVFVISRIIKLSVGIILDIT